MFMLASIAAIVIFAWMSYRLLPVSTDAPQGLGLIALCLLLIAFGAFFMYLAYVDLLVGELIEQSRHSHRLIARSAEPGHFWLGIAGRFLVGSYLVGSAIVLPFLQRRDSGE